MNVTKNDLIGDLVRYVNGLEKGSKTVAYMTALLISWKDMDEATVSNILRETMVALNYYEIVSDTASNIPKSPKQGVIT